MEAHIRILADEEKVATLNLEIITQNSLKGSCRLFILHYAGHAIVAAPSNILVITFRIKFKGPQMSMIYIRDRLMHLAEDSDGLDILLMLNCCCAAIAERGKLIGGKRMELMAATPVTGLRNSREDHPKLTFTQCWCIAFEIF